MRGGGYRKCALKVTELTSVSLAGMKGLMQPDEGDNRCPAKACDLYPIGREQPL